LGKHVHWTQRRAMRKLVFQPYLLAIFRSTLLAPVAALDRFLLLVRRQLGL
jgi:hypothetical protein